MEALLVNRILMKATSLFGLTRFEVQLSNTRKPHLNHVEVINLNPNIPYYLINLVKLDSRKTERFVDILSFSKKKDPQRLSFVLNWYRFTCRVAIFPFVLSSLFLLNWNTFKIKIPKVSTFKFFRNSNWAGKYFCWLQKDKMHVS